MHLLPIWAFRYPALTDYPNHLTRCFILAQYDTVPAFREWFEVKWTILPNLGVNLLLVPLMRVLEPITAGKVFLTLLICLFHLGCHLISRSIHSRGTWLASVATLWVYGSAFRWGFVNYLLGIGWFMTILALWWNTRERSGVTPYALLAFGSVSAYCIHLSAFVFLLLACLVTLLYDIAHGACRYRHFYLSAGGYAVCAGWPAVFLFERLTSQKGSETWLYKPLSFKALHVFQQLSVCYGLLPSVSVLLVLAVLYGLTRSRQSQLPNSLLAAMIYVVFFFAYLLTPYEALSVSAVDTRWVLPTILFWLLSRGEEAGRHRIALVLVVTAGLIQLVGNTRFMASADSAASQQLSVLRQLPREAKVYPVYNLSSSMHLGQRLVHVIHYATIERQVFVPTLFAWRGQDPLLVRRTAYERLSPFTEFEDVDWNMVFADFDYVFGYDLNAEQEAFLQSHCRLVGQRGPNKLYQVVRGNRLPSSTTPTSQPRRESQR